MTILRVLTSVVAQNAITATFQPIYQQIKEKVLNPDFEISQNKIAMSKPYKKIWINVKASSQVANKRPNISSNTYESSSIFLRSTP